jgi:hypothetical protein
LYYHRADPAGGPGDDAVMEHRYYYNVYGEPEPAPTSPCPDCRGTGQVMLLVSSVPCEKCRGTGKSLTRSARAARFCPRLDPLAVLPVAWFTTFSIARSAANPSSMMAVAACGGECPPYRPLLFHSVTVK